MNVNFITPPHTACTIKRCLGFAEGISDHRSLQLFLDLSGEAALGDETFVPILAGAGAGFTPEEPMALVHCPASPTSPSAVKKYPLKAKFKRRLYFYFNIHKRELLTVTHSVLSWGSRVARTFEG
jgi:hypothetical protein